jgi:pimeloyl-ACP methyl ester carboxylesterase
VARAPPVSAGGVSFAYRELGPKTGVPVVFLTHLAAVLDNWDARVVHDIAAQHRVITFDNRGVGASTGEVPDSVEAMADDAYTFIRALGFDKIDVFSFSLGGMVAQALVVKHPELVRKLALTGTGPAGGEGIETVTRLSHSTPSAAWPPCRTRSGSCSSPGRPTGAERARNSWRS